MFSDRQKRPSPQEIENVLGARFNLWDSLVRFIADGSGAGGDLAFYGKNYGWAVRFRKNGRALLSLYPGSEGFTAQIIMSPAQVEAASPGMTDVTRQAIEGSSPYSEGRWLFLRVETPQDLEEVKRLLKVKLRAVRPASSHPGENPMTRPAGGQANA